MDALRGGSEEAAGEIAELYTPHLLRAVRRTLPQAIRSKIDSVDIVNTLWASLLIKRQRLEGIKEPGQLVALLKAAARNRVVDEHRRYTEVEARDIRCEAGRYDEIPVKAGDGAASPGRHRVSNTTPSEVAMTRETWERFKASLSSRDQEVVACRISGSTYEEIAESIEGVSARTARRIIAEAKTQLMR